MADEGTMGVDDLTDRFRGKGTWRESAGERGDYDAFLTIRPTDDGFEIRQRHVHAGAASEDTFLLDRAAPYLYSVEAANQHGGFGLVMNDLVRFHINNHLGGITDRLPGEGAGCIGCLRVH